MSTLGKILTALGIAFVILGALAVGLGLITEFRDFGDQGPVYGLEGVVTGVTMLFWGLVLSAGGATLHAIRSIAVNCAKLADASRSSDQGET